LSELPRPKRFAILREFVPADMLTLANASAGAGCVLCCLQYLAEEQEPLYMWVAFALIPLAFLMDALDGWVARKMHRSSMFGLDLDSLADIVSFGVAPAVVGFTLGLRGGWDTLILIYFIACGISRLARFNVTAESMSDESGKVKYFEGTPIPTSIVIVAMLAVAYATGAIGDEVWGGYVFFLSMKLHPLALVYALSGSAMISSTLRIPKI
jgi:CDP-diacylglycerol--serine O-phosphatidyltransferase